MVHVVTVALALLALSGLASAADGVIEINQSVALAGAVNGNLVADPAGFPVNITQPGSYRLTGNLDVRVAPNPQNVDAIDVGANDVSIDLNGFAIYGPTVCTGTPPTTLLSCTPQGVGRGIDAGIRNNVSVFGGTVNGAGSYGIYCGFGCRIERMHVENSGLEGITAADGSLIFGNTSRRNQNRGIQTSSQGGLTIRGNSVLENGFGGIYAGGTSVVEGNLVRENRGIGISVGEGTVAGNAVRDNSGAGIGASDGSLVIDNTVYGNTGLGLINSPSVGYGRNMIYSNAGGTVNGGIQIAPNVCETDTICP